MNSIPAHSVDKLLDANSNTHTTPLLDGHRAADFPARQHEHPLTDSRDTARRTAQRFGADVEESKAATQPPNANAASPSAGIEALPALTLGYEEKERHSQVQCSPWPNEHTAQMELLWVTAKQAEAKQRQLEATLQTSKHKRRQREQSLAWFSG